MHNGVGIYLPCLLSLRQFYSSVIQLLPITVPLLMAFTADILQQLTALKRANSCSLQNWIDRLRHAECCTEIDTVSSTALSKR